MRSESRGRMSEYMTPLEQKIVEEFKATLEQESISEPIIEAVITGFNAEKPPAAEALAQLIKAHSGGPSA
jgi:hypothetical protein